MKRSIPVIQRKRGPAPTGKTPVASLRLPPELAERIDAWAAKQKDAPSRSEAIRRLIQKALGKARAHTVDL
ncbi:ribbon-helix-helix protein, CopG family [Methylocystis sp. FS]|uniref:CopG family ribbon-helix-helix protein n=1 Tax=Methylocystis silviterrae TaxID=2743612 RepID=UPI001582C8EE|nr:ribbon-helix-helix protein, CopG family [Methylocystis silviterrae]